MSNVELNILYCKRLLKAGIITPEDYKIMIHRLQK